MAEKGYINIFLYDKMIYFIVIGLFSLWQARRESLKSFLEIIPVFNDLLFYSSC